MVTIFNAPLGSTNAPEDHTEITEKVTDFVRRLEVLHSKNQAIDVDGPTASRTSAEIDYFLERVKRLLTNPHVSTKPEAMQALKDCESELAKAQKLWQAVQGRQLAKASPKMGG